MKKYLLSAIVCSLFGHIGVATATVPGQFIAKMYSEVLGRAPDTGGWNSAMQDFAANGCSLSTLTSWGSSIFSSGEFAGLDYDNGAIMLIIYRAILNREPDSSGYNTWLNSLNSGTSLATAVASFFASTEFSELVSQICSGNSYSFGYLGSGFAIKIPTPHAGGTAEPLESQLQSDLMTLANTGGGTFYLQQESVVTLTQTLLIPSTVTLATYGSPTTHQHALMARLVRNGAFATPGPMVEISSGASLKNVWVDGQRFATSTFSHDDINIQINGGSGVVVDSNFVANTLGWSSLHSFSALNGDTCSSNTVTNNVITVYPSVHVAPPSGSQSTWADGLSIGCEHSTVESNQIIDATDVGIVVYTAGLTAIQESIVSGNTVISAGNSAFGALAFDPLLTTTTTVCTGGTCQTQGRGTPSFAGASIENNTLWTSPSTHFVIGLAIGSVPWFGGGNSSLGNAELGTGASATGNTTDSILSNFGEGITVSGMLSATVESNTFTRSAVTVKTNCPLGNVFASESAGFASGSIQAFTNSTVDDCISDNSQN